MSRFSDDGDGLEIPIRETNVFSRDRKVRQQLFQKSYQREGETGKCITRDQDITQATLVGTESTALGTGDQGIGL